MAKKKKNEDDKKKKFDVSSLVKAAQKVRKDMKKKQRNKVASYFS
jgi:hypothetical protein